MRESTNLDALSVLIPGVVLQYDISCAVGNLQPIPVHTLLAASQLHTVLLHPEYEVEYALSHPAAVFLSDVATQQHGCVALGLQDVPTFTTFSPVPKYPNPLQYLPS